MLITISREYGAGGSALAATVGERLGWPVIDNELVDEVARRAGLTPDEVKQREERGPTFVERLARAFAVATPELLTPDNIELPEREEHRLVRITEQVVADAAKDHAVLVGRAALVVIPAELVALHLRVVASPSYRADAIAQRLGLSPSDAARQVRDVDAHRAGYHRQHYQRDWADPRNYHLVLNTEKLGVEWAAAIVVATVQARR